MSAPHIGALATEPATARPDLLAEPVFAALKAHAIGDVWVAEIDPDVADTAALCERYDVDLAVSANCVVVGGKREGRQRVAACLVLATTRADVNNVVKRYLDVRKASFLSMDDAVEATGMEYGGITPIGLPESWSVLVDPGVAALSHAVIGSGVRRSKLTAPGSMLATLPNAEIVEGLAKA
jgi:prolyl-tRNA editing enzyme YbaK/EbsC (Cys-tRNA(Pro) deacylase)